MYYSPQARPDPVEQVCDVVSRAEVDDEEESVLHPNGRNDGRVGLSLDLPPAAAVAIRSSNILTCNQLLK